MSRKAVFSTSLVLLCMFFGALFQRYLSGSSLHSPNEYFTRARTGFDIKVGPFSWDELPPNKELKWTKCYVGRQCALLIVPLNYSEPEGREAVIALVRKPALIHWNDRIYRGPVLFNPGGPGGSGVDLISGIGGDLFSKILGPQFDIVGFDPRGVARSTPRASFFATEYEREIWGRKACVANNSDEGIARTWARNRIVGAMAAENDIDGQLKHINTDQTARDMLRIVEAHGRTKLQYWGFSYGSVLGATFASMFPDKVERIVIDGVVDAEDYYSTLWSNNLMDTDKAMDLFFTGCSKAGPHGCAFWAPTPEDIKQNLTALYMSIRSNPIPMRTEKGYGLLDYSMLRSVVFGSLYTPHASFVGLAKVLAALAAGDGQPLFDAMNPHPFQCSCDSSEKRFDTLIDGSGAILCNDGDDIPGDLASSEEHFSMVTKISGWEDIWANIWLGCVGWPKFPKNHFRGPFKAKTSFPILLIGNTADPVTPLWAAKKMSQGFDGSVVLTQDSAGHCSISAPSLCTQIHVHDYFVFGHMPKPGTVCAPIGKPFPISGLDAREDEQQAALISSISPDDRNIYDAILELSRTSILPPLGFPILGSRNGVAGACN